MTRKGGGLLAALAVPALTPLGFLLVASLGRTWRWPAALPSEWDLHAWRYAAAPESGVAAALATSTGIAVAVTVLALAAALPASRYLAWHTFPGKRIFFFFLLLPVLSPPLAAAMGLHAVFLRLGLAETTAGVVLAHLIPAVPYAILMLTGSFTRLDPDLEAQARTLGATPSQAFRSVTLPSIAPGLALAAAFVFLISWSQYLLTLLIGGSGTVTLPLLLVSFVHGGDPAIAAALTLFFVLPAVSLFVLAARHLRYDL